MTGPVDQAPPSRGLSKTAIILIALFGLLFVGEAVFMSVAFTLEDDSLPAATPGPDEEPED